MTVPAVLLNLGEKELARVLAATEQLAEQRGGDASLAGGTVIRGGPAQQRDSVADHLQT